jgi:hypothetical protein
MGQGRFWDANSFWASREILYILWTPKLYPAVHKSPPLVTILSQMSLIHPTFVIDSVDK